jgi:ABC-2 type transport system ATP-binding protein
MINVQNLSFSYLNHQVLNSISIDFQEHQIYGIVGLNGAGKTTFFNVLSTFLKTQTGDIKLNGNRITYKDIAYLETSNFFYSRITGNEYLKIFHQTNPDFNLGLLQEFMKLPLDELIETYSTGMKKKLALLAVLKQDKAIFLLDEPFNGLDLETNKILELIITKIKEKGKTVFVSSHIIDPLLSICDTMLYLENGKFTKTFARENFQLIEDELFTKLKTEAKTIISQSI